MFARRFHRILVLIMLVIGLTMAFTGICMYSGYYFSFDPLTVRMVHRQLSIVFALLFGLMGLTGSYLFIFPYLR